jgi:hypothetical protein
MNTKQTKHVQPLSPFGRRRAFMKSLCLAALMGCLAVQANAQVDLTVNGGVSFTIPNVSPATPGATYRWLENGSVIPPATAVSYTTSKNTAGTYVYFRQAKTAECEEWMSSNPFVVAVTCSATRTSLPATENQTVCHNSPVTNITYSTVGVSSLGNVNIENLPDGVEYSWASNVLTISGAPTAAGTFVYTVRLCGTVAATTGTITVTALPTVTTTSPATICYNAKANLSCTVSGGTTTAMTYTWKIGTATSVTTVPTVTSANLTAATTYSVAVTNANGCTSTVSNTGTILVALDFTQGNPVAQAICNGAKATFSLTEASGGLGAITYRWEQSSDNSNWAPAATPNNTAAYTTPALTNGSYYRRVAISANCGTITSASAYVSTHPAFTAGSINTVNLGTTQGVAPTTNPTNASEASGGDGSKNYEWRRSGTNSKTLGSSNSSGYTISNDATNYNTAGTFYFKRYAKDGCNTTFTESNGQYTLYVNTAGATPPDAASTVTWVLGNLTWSDVLKRTPQGCSFNYEGLPHEDNPQARYQLGYANGGWFYNWLCLKANMEYLCMPPWRIPTYSDVYALLYYTDKTQRYTAFGLGGFAGASGQTNGDVYGYMWNSESIISGVYANMVRWSQQNYDEEFENHHMSDGAMVRCVRD